MKQSIYRLVVNTTIVLLLLVLLGLRSNLLEATVPNTFVDATVAKAEEVNENFDYFEIKFSTTGGHDHDGSDSKAITVLDSLISVSTITTGVWQGTIVDEVYGGTGLASYTTGDIIQATADNVLGKLSPGASGTFLQSQGANTEVAYSKVDLADTADVTGTLAETNGGTGVTSGVMVEGDSAGGDLTGTYPNPTLETGNFKDVQFFGTAGTWTRPAGIDFVYVKIWGGGGGAGGSDTANGCGGGGGAGGYTEGIVAVTGNVTVTIGAGGTGGATGTGTGGTGGTSNFVGSTTPQATGGVGGTHDDSGTGGAGGVGSSGTVNLTGGVGNPGTVAFFAGDGQGGGAPFGPSGGIDGSNGAQPGAGGGGGDNGASGGDGGDGMAIVYY